MGLLLTCFLLTVFASFTCSILESVLFSVTPPFMESYPKLHPRSGKILQFLKANLDNAIGAILIVNLFANTIGAAGVGVLAVEVFGESWHGVVALGMTITMLYIAEIIPKTIGATYWKMLILPVCYVVLAFYWITFPLVYISRILTRIFKDNQSQQMNRDEVLAVVELGEQSGSINELESDILEHLIAQKSLSTKDIMTPKSQIFSMDEETSVKEAVKLTQEHKYSRIPLYTLLPNNITSLIYRKNILQARLNGKKKKPLKVFAKHITKVEEHLGLLDLLEKFISKKEHLFLVVDSRDNLVGIVSLDDVINAVLNVGIDEEESKKLKKRRRK